MTTRVIGAWSFVLEDIVLYLNVFPFMLYDVYEMSYILYNTWTQVVNL